MRDPRESLIINLLLLVLIPVGISGQTKRAEHAGPPASADCISGEYRQFDFWLGDWDVFEGSQLAARVKVTSILNGCALHEEYTGADGLYGESFSNFDRRTGKWHQTWVTDRGQYLVIDGGMESREMHLSTSNKTVGELVRGVWSPSANGVREIAWKSKNGGKTWDPWFDLMFVPHKQSQSQTDDHDAAEVTELDRTYQAAVEKNDAEGMSKILSDDFLINTGRGKRYNKTDLLEEARSKKYIYERQDDSEKTVRVFGDVAVVTAKLFAKGTEEGKPFEYTLWFTDVYRKTPSGWRYVYAQSSLPLQR